MIDTQAQTMQSEHRFPYLDKHGTYMPLGVSSRDINHTR